MHAPPNPRAICHCLLLEDEHGLALVDTGLGLADVRHPVERFGRELIDMIGFVFDESHTAVRRIGELGFSPEAVGHIVLTHADPDHTGGLPDFPHAQVHVSSEEHASLARGHFRYLPVHFEHGPRWSTHPPQARRWFGLEARVVPLGFSSEVLLIPLFGHTLGHCGVAIQQGSRWALHVGDAYYLRAELASDDHPISILVAQRAVDDAQRRVSLERLRHLARNHGDEVDLFGYHDPLELPS